VNARQKARQVACLVAGDDGDTDGQGGWHGGVENCRAEPTG
jgi:hypothetical protein